MRVKQNLFLIKNFLDGKNSTLLQFTIYVVKKEDESNIILGVHRVLSLKYLS